MEECKKLAKEYDTALKKIRDKFDFAGEASIKATFEIYDKNKDGLLSIKEFSEASLQHKINVTP